MPNFVEIFAQVFKLFLLACSTVCPIGPALRPIWIPLSEGWMKVNVDAVVSPGCYMDGVVAWASDGFILAWRTMLLSSSSPQLAKAKGCLLAIQMAIDFGWNYCIFEEDALVVIEACRNPDPCP